jgi:site-specific recombinase XerD
MATPKIFLYKHKKLNDGSYPIVLQIIKDRKRRLISLGHSATLEQWDFAGNKPTKKHPNHKDLVLIIQKKLYQANKTIMELEDSDKPYTIDDIIFKLKSGKSSSSVFKYMDEFIKKLEKTGKTGNATIYTTTLNVFKKFRNEKDLTFNQFSYRVVKDFEESQLEKKIKINTISIYLRTLRAIYNYAIKDKVAQQSLYPFKDFRIKSEITAKRALPKEDITKIRNLKLDEGSELYKARDYFLFSFNMRGMSFVDMAFLKNSDIVEDRLQYSRKKTGQKISIKITTEAQIIMDKYTYSTGPDSFIFQIIDRKGQEYLDYRNALRLTNKKLRLIGEMAKCTIRVSTYVSRHSWATIAKRAGVSTAVISEGLGHGSEKTTQIYLDSFENKVLDDANELVTG